MNGMGSSNYCAEELESRMLLSGGFTPVADLPAVDAGVSVNQVATSNGKFYFIGSTTDDIERLYASTAVGGATLLSTAAMKGTGSTFPEFGIGSPTAFNNKLYFFANLTHDSFMETDGTPAGTKQVRLLHAGTTGALPNSIVIYNGKMFYLDPGITSTLVMSDGTSGGSSVVYTFNNAVEGYYKLLTVVNGKLLFQANSKLYISDGTAPGTTPIAGSSFLNTEEALYWVTVGNKFYLLTKVLNGPANLYAMNIDFGGFSQVALPDNDPNFNTNMNDLKVAGGKALVTASEGSVATVYSLDNAGTFTPLLVSSPSLGFLPFGQLQLEDKVVWVRQDIARSLWVTDGTVSGTKQLRTVPLNQGSSRGFAGDGTRGYLVDGYYTTAGNRMIITDGTAAGTRELVLPRYYFRMFDGYNGQLIIAHGPTTISLFDPFVATGSIRGGAFTDTTRDNILQGFETAFSGTAYLDLNNNGSFESGDFNMVVDRGFSFDNLVVDNYIARYKPTSTTSFANPAAGFYQVELTANAVVTTNFTNTPAGTVVWGNVFNDVNRNATRDAGEGGLAAHNIYLDLDANGYRTPNEPQVTSASDGTYGFVDPPSLNLSVRRNFRANFSQTVPANRGGYSITVPSGGVAQVGDFGAVAVPTVNVRGTFWNDWNQNGQRDAGDTHVSTNAASVYADINNNGARDFDEPMTTLGGGFNYLLTNLPGEVYAVRSIFPAQYIFTSPGAFSAKVDLRQGGTVRVGDGFVLDTTAAVPPGKISGIVWLDSNGNGIKDLGEQGIPDRVVWLDADVAAIRSVYERFAVTDANGYYEFPTTPAGTFRVNTVLDEGWEATTPANATRTVTISTSTPAVQSDFGVLVQDAIAPELTAIDFQYLSGGTNFVLNFTENVNVPPLSTGDFEVRDLLTGDLIPSQNLTVSFDAGFSIARIGYVGGIFSNGNYLLSVIAAGVTDFAGNPVTGTLTSAPAFFQQGDANRDRAVDALDFNILAANFGTAGNWGEGNFDYGSGIDSVDFAIFVAEYGKKLAASPAFVSETSIGIVGTPAFSVLPFADGRDDVWHDLAQVANNNLI